MTTKLHDDAINALSHGEHGAPHQVLGLHQIDKKTVAIRAMRPGAKKLTVINETDNARIEMKKLREQGFFEASFEGDVEDLTYHYEVEMEDGTTETFFDPYNQYQFELWLTDFERHLFGEGRYLYSYDKFGAHVREIDGIRGVNFIIWAPNAKRISVVGDFNNWDERQHPMIPHESGGIWELFIPGMDYGDKYKYELKSHNMGYRATKSDPYGFQFELRPKTACIVTDIDSYEWNDETWMDNRDSKNPLESAMSVYEVHLGSWKRKDGYRWLTYRELADELIAYVKEMGYTHIELMPVAEHPFDGSWGYQITGYYAVTSRFGTPEDFMYFVDQCHQNNIGVILDWVPAHFPKDGFALSYFDGTHLYSHEDSRRGEHPDWGTYIFNYGRNEVRNFLVSNALYWVKKFHIDGLRVDAVSSMIYLNFSREDGEWLPNQYGSNENLEAISFMQDTNIIIHEEAPGAVTIAEESTAWPMVSRPTYLGGLGFTLKWNMGWMHDTLLYISREPVHRKWHHNTLTFSMVYAYNENFVLSLSHDEVVHGKGSLMGKIPGDWWQKFATLRTLFGYQYTHPGKKLNFMTADIAQWSEWSEERSLDWHLLQFPTHQQLQKWVKDLNHFYRNQPALFELDFESEGFRWLEANDAANSTFSYIRFAKDESDFVVIVMNFTPVPREHYRLGVPSPGFYQEMLNSDAAEYGGGNINNNGGVEAEWLPWQGYGHSIEITLPPLAIVIFKPVR